MQRFCLNGFFLFEFCHRARFFFGFFTFLLFCLSGKSSQKQKTRRRNTCMGRGRKKENVDHHKENDNDGGGSWMEIQQPAETEEKSKSTTNKQTILQKHGFGVFWFFLQCAGGGSVSVKGEGRTSMFGVAETGASTANAPELFSFLKSMHCIVCNSMQSNICIHARVVVVGGSPGRRWEKTNWWPPPLQPVKRSLHHLVQGLRETNNSENV